MKRAIAAAAILLSGCIDTADTFEVTVTEGHPAGASLTLCGKTTPLGRNPGSTYLAHRRVTCEGAGSIEVRFSDGASIRCPVGYVTPGLAQVFEVAVSRAGCKPLV